MLPVPQHQPGAPIDDLPRRNSHSELLLQGDSSGPASSSPLPTVYVGPLDTLYIFECPWRQVPSAACLLACCVNCQSRLFWLRFLPPMRPAKPDCILQLPPPPCSTTLSPRASTHAVYCAAAAPSFLPPSQHPFAAVFPALRSATLRHSAVLLLPTDCWCTTLCLNHTHLNHKHLKASSK